MKPIWEDPRNNKGGAWTFRIPKTGGNSGNFWREIQLMAIGEVLQEVVEKGTIDPFPDISNHKIQKSNLLSQKATTSVVFLYQFDSTLI